MQPYVLMLQTDTDDKEITELVLANIELPMRVEFLDNEDKLGDFFLSIGKPALILINENTRRIGVEVVKRFKNDSALRHIPLVVLKEHTIPEYIDECYEAGASTVITKPSSIGLTFKKIETFFAYWFQVAELPARKETVIN